MNICEDCICRKYCGDDDIKRCDRYFRDSRIKKEPTNEEWFVGLSTEEKAKFMCNIYEMGKNGKQYFMRLDKCVEWLKQPHTIKEKHDDNL